MSDKFDSVYRELSDKERETIGILKSKASELYSLIETSQNSHNGYYLNQALSSLEQVVMLAIRGLTLPPAPEPEVVVEPEPPVIVEEPAAVAEVAEETETK